MYLERHEQVGKLVDDKRCVDVALCALSQKLILGHLHLARQVVELGVVVVHADDVFCRLVVRGKLGGKLRVKVKYEYAQDVLY